MPRALRAAEHGELEERFAVLAFLAGRGVVVDPDERHAALRRSQLLLAAGGDPRRTLELDGRAVTALAADLDAPGSRRALEAALEELEPAVAELPSLAAALLALRADRDLAWRAFALAVLAEDLDD